MASSLVLAQATIGEPAVMLVWEEKMKTSSRILKVTGGGRGGWYLFIYLFIHF